MTKNNTEHKWSMLFHMPARVKAYEINALEKTLQTPDILLKFK